jgi:hypothetical protein
MNFGERASTEYGLQMGLEKPFLKVICTETTSGISALWLHFRLGFGSISGQVWSHHGREFPAAVLRDGCALAT